MSARTWGYSGLGWGLLASLAANLEAALAHGGDSPAPLLGALFWPIAVLVAFELVFRARIRSLGDVIALFAVGAVGLGAGWISFGHSRELLVGWGESPTGATLGALAIDGLLIASALTIHRESTGASASALASALVDDERAPSAHSGAPALAPSAPAHSDADALASALAHSDASALADAPRVRSRVAAASASAPRVQSSALVDECTPSAPASADASTSALAPSALVHDADLLVRLRRDHPECTSVRGIMRALGVGQTRAKRLRAALDEACS